MSFELMWRIIADWIYPGLLVVFFFGLTIFIHEFGHFLVAKWRGMKIERFSLGFGPKIFGWMGKDGVDYRVSWIPFGGYVALPQMAPMEAFEGKSDARPEDIPPAPPASKIYVALAGPVFNCLMALALGTIVFVFGLPTPINSSVVGWVEPGSREQQLGIREGDRIVEVGNEVVNTWDDVMKAAAFNEGASVRVVTERDQHRQEYLLETEYIRAFGIKIINLYPQGRPYASSILKNSPAERAGLQSGDRFLAVEGVAVTTRGHLQDLIGKRPNLPTHVKVMRHGRVISIMVTPIKTADEKVGRIGVTLEDQVEFHLVRPGPTPWVQINDTLLDMGRMVKAIANYRETKVGVDTVSGPLGISVGLWNQVAHGGVLRGVWFAVIINVALAVFNLLPIPVLDGGHILFGVIEAVRRRPLNAVLMHRVSTFFAVLLIGFVLYVTFNDFRRFIPWARKPSPRFTPESEGTNAPARNP